MTLPPPRGWESRVHGVPYSPDCVAEYALTLMLMAARNLGAVLSRVHEGDYRLEPHRARELRDMRVGVVGTGRIGARVIALLRAFGCTVAAYDRVRTENVNYLPLDELLAQSDLVTLHLPSYRRHPPHAQPRAHRAHEARRAACQRFARRTG